MKLTFLGTSGMVPTKDRNVQGLYLDYNGEGILLDCGEGTQRQITHAGLNAQKIRKILISHWHGDHVIGLPGLLQTLANFRNQEKSLTLYGPVGSKDFISHMKQSCIADAWPELDIIELDPDSSGTEVFYENDDYCLEVAKLEHGVDCLGYALVKKERYNIDMQKLQSLGVSPGPHLAALHKGEDITVDGKEILASEVTTKKDSKKIAFVFDTKLTDACFDLAEGANILVSEAVYTSELEHKAEQYKHLTAKQVAQVASQCGVEQLILTHFSQRYKTSDVLLDDAKQLFENVTCAYDFYSVEL
jgi:ribonuclease Z